MKDQLSEYLFNELREYLQLNLGLNYTPRQIDELSKRISKAATEFEFSDMSSFVIWILENNLTSQELTTLASFLTIGETYFLRESIIFEYLTNTYLPDLIEQRSNKEKRLRIWCAACASGEEAYTIAIMLHKIIPDIKNWNITILATDINSTFLKKAEEGIYSKWSFRNTPQWYIDKNFKKTEDNKYQILPEIRKMVTFASLNLAKDNYPSLINNTNAIDIIFCRNVLIYFSSQVIKSVTNRLYKSLLKGGVLIVSAVEVSNFISSKFNNIKYNGSTIYQKGLSSVIPDTKLNNVIQGSSTRSKLIKEYQIGKTVKSKLTEREKQIPQKITNKPQEKKITKQNLPDFKIAVTLFDQGLFDEAENLLAKLLSTDNENYKSIISLLAKTKANLGKLEEALTLCEKALKADKLDHNLYFLMASIKQEQGNDQEAISFLNKAIYLDQEFVLAHFLLGNLSVKYGKKAAGIKYYNNAVNILSKLDPKETLPESDGLTVGQFTEVINAIVI